MLLYFFLQSFLYCNSIEKVTNFNNDVDLNKDTFEITWVNKCDDTYFNFYYDVYYIQDKFEVYLNDQLYAVIPEHNFDGFYEFMDSSLFKHKYILADYPKELLLDNVVNGKGVIRLNLGNDLVTIKIIMNKPYSQVSFYSPCNYYNSYKTFYSCVDSSSTYFWCDTIYHETYINNCIKNLPNICSKNNPFYIQGSYYEIYDRWGNLIYSGHGKWANGEIGVYIWKYKNLTGTVTLVK